MMKSKLQLLVPAAAIALIISLAAAFGQAGSPAKPPPGNRPPNQPTTDVPNPPGYGGGAVPNPPGYGGGGYNPYRGVNPYPSPGGPMIDPATGLPITRAPSTSIDPTTGLPVPQTEQQWVDESCDPGIVLTNISYQDLPLSEIARDLSQRFKGEIDFLPLPQWGNQDWRSTQLALQLRNVRASQIFSAMNMVFENDRTPLRWELKKNGDRPTALLRVLPDGAPEPPSAFGPGMPMNEPVRRIYFVGDLTEENLGGMPMEQIAQTITEVWAMIDNTGGNLQFHKAAQLLVVRGTPGQIDAIEQTLSALRQKVELARRFQSKPKPNTDEKSKSGAPVGSR